MHRQTKTPPEVNRGGVFATVWLPFAKGLSIYSRFSQSFTWVGLASYRFRTALPVVSGRPLGSKCSTRVHSPLMYLVYPITAYMEVPQWTFKTYRLSILKPA